ncbi:Protein ECERIFERUM 1 [Forsythia ovata]|uniref:Protein ECERIFERUM 1 n=1 Tax=Forsythia ovata TaxID=205694 RepID=A0ABD1SPI6_9LAMI
MYDYIYGTMDKSTDAFYETSLKRKEDIPDVVHLTHLTTAESIFHLQIGFASFASKPQNSKWYMWLMWPVTWWSVVLNLVRGRSFIVERNSMEKLRMQSRAIRAEKSKPTQHYA